MAYEHGRRAKRMPRWLARPILTGGRSLEVRGVLDSLSLNTVCESARCPNKGECFGRGTATFMIMGDVCTRDCSFCAVEGGRPAPLDPDEPRRVAEAAVRMGLSHVVVTSVTRDDLPDGGAAHFAATVREIRAVLPDATVEVLTSDFAGSMEAVDAVVDSAPDVFNHNVETVPRLYPEVCPLADYERSLCVLARAKEVSPEMPTKSGLMLGLGETLDEVEEVLRDLRSVGCDFLTVGQYLRPGRGCHEVVEFVPPERFDDIARLAEGMGFAGVASAPFVRSSYRAEQMCCAKGPR
ncbi:MAG: lipoyl synthase [Coriobacteriia bacterium]